MSADEKLLSSIRCKVEHAFHRIKVQFGYKKVRYRGLAKNTARLTIAGLHCQHVHRKLLRKSN
ncbi:MAG: transposase [Parasutterella sp.]